MKAFALILAMYAGSLGPSLALAQPVIPPHNAQYAFEFACEILAVDCSTIPAPKVLWARGLYNHLGEIAGGYDGGDTIYMNALMMRYADEVFIDSVLAHESAHYIDVQLGYVSIPYTIESVCASEMHGWRVGNAYAIVHGRPDFADFTWAERYGCFL